MRSYYVYILSSFNQRLYIGVTNDLKKRVWQHKQKDIEGHTSKYNIDRLVYFEETSDVKAAIEREKQLKKWNREWKERIITEKNPAWNDLFNQINQ